MLVSHFVHVPGYIPVDLYPKKCTHAKYLQQVSSRWSSPIFEMWRLYRFRTYLTCAVSVVLALLSLPFNGNWNTSWNYKDNQSFLFDRNSDELYKSYRWMLILHIQRLPWENFVEKWPLYHFPVQLLVPNAQVLSFVPQGIYTKWICWYSSFQDIPCLNFVDSK